jgi:hypothetical protein
MIVNIDIVFSKNSEDGGNYFARNVDTHGHDYKAPWSSGLQSWFGGTE